MDRKPLETAAHGTPDTGHVDFLHNWSLLLCDGRQLPPAWRGITQASQSSQDASLWRVLKHCCCCCCWDFWISAQPRSNCFERPPGTCGPKTRCFSGTEGYQIVDSRITNDVDQVRAAAGRKEIEALAREEQVLSCGVPNPTPRPHRSRCFERPYGSKKNPVLLREESV